VLLLTDVTQLCLHLGFLLAFLPQLVLGALAPALVLCHEADGARAVELSVAGCCESETVAVDVANEVHGVDDCGGCEDAALELSLQREEGHTTLLVALACVAPTVELLRGWDALPSPLAAAAPDEALAGALTALRTVQLRC